MHLCKEIYRDDYSATRKEIFYNDQKKIIGVLETAKTDTGEYGNLSVYEYEGEHHRIIRYSQETKSYQTFITKGAVVLKTTNWHNIAEATHILELKYEKGLLIAEYNHDMLNNRKTSLTCSYSNGNKISETRTDEDGTIVRNEFGYLENWLQSVLTLRNNQFLEQIIYVRGNNEILLEKQKFLMHQNTQYLAHQEVCIYNIHQELQKTEYYGKYDGRMCLYKTDENIWNGNVLTKKSELISNADWVVGHYNMDVLFSSMPQEQREWAKGIFDKQYMERTGFDVKTKTIETYDDNRQLVLVEWADPVSGKETPMVKYRNEYNEQAMPEFVISYKVEDDKTVETGITKYYYCE